VRHGTKDPRKARKYAKYGTAAAMSQFGKMEKMKQDTCSWETSQNARNARKRAKSGTTAPMSHSDKTKKTKHQGRKYARREKRENQEAGERNISRNLLIGGHIIDTSQA
jgi:hypothetical protein